MAFKIGDYVRKNPAMWVPNIADPYGRGKGIGQIVEPPCQLQDGEFDVQWPGGRWFEKANQLLPADASKIEQQPS